MMWRSYSTSKKRINLNSACTVPFLYSPDFFRIMPFTTLAYFSVPYASISNSSVGTALYDRVYNDDLASIKVQLMNMMNMNRLGFPFRVVYDGSRSLYVSPESYEFQERFCLSDRARTQSVTFSFNAPSKEQEQLSWPITVPSRGSSFHERIPCTSWLGTLACSFK